MQYINSWEAILRGVKPEYLGLDSEIGVLEIYSLGPQVSIIAPQKMEKNAGGLARKLQPSREVPREQSFRGLTVELEALNFLIQHLMVWDGMLDGLPLWWVWGFTQ